MPLNTLSFLAILNDFNADKFKPQTVKEVMNPEVLLKAYKWLVCYLLKISAEKFNSAQQRGKDAFTAKNDSQVYAARTLSIAFIEHYSLESFWKGMCQNPDLPPEIRNILVKLLLLYGLWSLEKHLAILYQGGYAQGPVPANIIREAILELCLGLKPESVALVDAIAPTDFVLNSAIGKSDGQIYKNLQQAMMQTPKGFERDSYWKDIVEMLKSKL
jgi:acyl-CoA oxidase